LTANNEIKIHELTDADIERLRALARGAFELDAATVEIKADDLLWLLLRAAPTPAGHAVVFWDGLGWYWSHNGKDREGPFGSAEGLDDAITDAKRAGFKIYEVNRTRGAMPAVGPRPIPEEVTFRQPTVADAEEMERRMPKHLRQP
jgi:hypothetical protein